MKLTVALTYSPLGIKLEQLSNRLTTQRRSTRKDKPNTAEVVFLAFILAAQDLHDDRRHDAELLDAELLNGGQELLELEALQDDDLVAAVLCDVCDHHEAVDVAKRQQAQRNLRVYSVLGAGDTLKCVDHESAGYDVVVRDHDSFLRLVRKLSNMNEWDTYRKTRRAAGVAKVSYLSFPLSWCPCRYGQRL
jgi:hypothetical protein